MALSLVVQSSYVIADDTGMEDQIPPASQAPVVVELFTAKTCVFCPQADKHLETISQTHSNVIALSCKVDFYDHSPSDMPHFCSERQKEYAMQITRGETYTPQVFLNGKDTAQVLSISEMDTAIKGYSGEGISTLRISRNRDRKTYSVNMNGEDMSQGNLNGQILYYRTIEEDQPKAGKTVKRKYKNAVIAVQGLAVKNSGENVSSDEFTFVTGDAYGDIGSDYDGFALLISDKDTREIVMAGQYDYTTPFSTIMPASGADVDEEGMAEEDIPTALEASDTAMPDQAE